MKKNKIMKNLTYNEKIAVLRILVDIIHVDHVAHEMEVAYIHQLADDFGIGQEYMQPVGQITTFQALIVLGMLSDEQKSQFAELMGKMIVADEEINYNEVKIYDIICKICDIRSDFQIREGIEYSLKGSFVNPEDLLNDSCWVDYSVCVAD